LKTRLFGTLSPICASPFLTFQQVVALSFGAKGAKGATCFFLLNVVVEGG
jgi:hypothetical protein